THVLVRGVLSQSSPNVGVAKGWAQDVPASTFVEGVHGGCSDPLMFTKTGFCKANSGARKAIATRPRINPRPSIASRFFRKRNSVYLSSEMRDAWSWRNLSQMRLPATADSSP